MMFFLTSKRRELEAIMVWRHWCKLRKTSFVHIESSDNLTSLKPWQRPRDVLPIIHLGKPSTTKLLRHVNLRVDLIMFGVGFGCSELFSFHFPYEPYFFLLQVHVSVCLCRRDRPPSFSPPPVPRRRRGLQDVLVYCILDALALLLIHVQG